MKKIIKISSLLAIAGLVAFNTYMATDIFKSNGTNLASLFSFNEAMAEYCTFDDDTDSFYGGELDEVRVQFRGNRDRRRCTYYTYTYNGSIVVSTSPGVELGVDTQQHIGSKFLCLSDTEDYCDYVGCGP